MRYRPESIFALATAVTLGLAGAVAAQDRGASGADRGAAGASSDDRGNSGSTRTSQDRAGSGASGRSDDAAGARGGDANGGQMMTIRGTVAGVTLTGETMIDFDTNTAATARQAYLTILGAPVASGGGAAGGPADDTTGSGRANRTAPGAPDESGPASAGRGGSSDRTSGASGRASGSTGRRGSDATTASDAAGGTEGGASAGRRAAAAADDRTGGAGAAGGNRSRRNVYVVAVDRDTKVMDAVSSPNAGTATSLDRLEIGDTVEVRMTAQRVAMRPADDQGAALRHGRGRIFRGRAQTIRILAEPADREMIHATEGGGRSGTPASTRPNNSSPNGRNGSGAGSNDDNSGGGAAGTSGDAPGSAGTASGAGGNPGDAGASTDTSGARSGNARTKGAAGTGGASAGGGSNGQPRR